MKYKGYWLCRKVETSEFLQIYHNFSALDSDFVFKILSFDECEFFLNDITAELHIIIAELSSNDDPDSWFPRISALSSLFPHLKIISILAGNPEHHFYYLNQLPFTYLIPESQVSALLPIGLDKAISELNYCRSVCPFTRISAEPALLSAAYFSTDNLTGKGKKGVICIIPTADVNIFVNP